MDAVWKRVEAIEEEMKICICETEWKSLDAERGSLLSRLSSVTSSDFISQENGLDFVRYMLEKCVNEGGEDYVKSSLRMTKRLLQMSRSRSSSSLLLSANKKGSADTPVREGCPSSSKKRKMSILPSVELETDPISTFSED